MKCPTPPRATGRRSTDRTGGPLSPLPNRELAASQRGSLTAFSRTDRTGLWHPCRTHGRTLACGYGYQRPGRTRGTDLRNKRAEIAARRHPRYASFGCPREEAPVMTEPEDEIAAAAAGRRPPPAATPGAH